MSPSDEAAPFLRTRIKVYLEDTDAGGIVYHANYLKYFERARTDWLEVHGVGLKGAQDRGVRFVVHALSIQYHRPAVLGDWLDVDTTVRRASPFRLSFDHRARRGAEGDPLTSCKVDVVAIDAEGELCEIDATLIRFE
jgi:tol-pal system-associated acyl-CoA thioesterase